MKNHYWPAACTQRRQSWAWWQTGSRWTRPTTASGLWTRAAVQRTAGIPSQESWCLLQKKQEINLRGLRSIQWRKWFVHYGALEQCCYFIVSRLTPIGTRLQEDHCCSLITVDISPLMHVYVSAQGSIRIPTWVKVLKPESKNTLLHVKVLH